MKKNYSILFLIFSFLFFNFSTFSGNIEVKNIEAQKTLVIKAEVPTMEVGNKMGELYGKLFSFLQENGIEPAGPPFAVYYSFEMEGNTVFECGFPVGNIIETSGDVKYKEFPKMMVVSLFYTGAYENMVPEYEKLQKYIEDNKLKATGTSWEVYLTDPNEVEPGQNQTIIYFPVEE